MRDYLKEAISILEGNSSIPLAIDHLRALESVLQVLAAREWEDAKNVRRSS